MGPLGFIGSFSENDVDADNTVVKTVPVYAGSVKAEPVVRVNEEHVEAVAKYVMDP